MDDDTHLCLNCHTTIVGLDSYILHRKAECPAKRAVASQQSGQTASSSIGNQVTVASTVATLQNVFAVNSDTAPLSVLPDAVPATLVELSQNASDNVRANDSCSYTPQDSLRVTAAVSDVADSTELKMVVTTADGSSSTRRTSLSVATPQSQLHTVSSILSPRTSQMIVDDPTLALYETETIKTDPSDDLIDTDNFQEHRDHASIEEFLSSLELQVRDPKDKSSEFTTKTQYSGETFEDRIKTLKIANILNDLDFSSGDSDGLPSDVDELLDYANADDDVEYAKSGGKWASSGKLGGKLSSHAEYHGGKGKGKNQPLSPGKGVRQSAGKLRPSLRIANKAVPGKWRPGEKPHIGKRRREEESDEEEEDTQKLNDAQEADHQEAVSGDEGNGDEVEEKDKKCFECKTCDKFYSSEENYERHLATFYHSKRLKKKRRPVKKPKIMELECPICNKAFCGRRNFAAHLVRQYHVRRERGAERPLLLDEALQVLLLKLSKCQCQVCGFYCNDLPVLIEHMETDEHINQCAKLTGPLRCTICKFSLYNHYVMKEHFLSVEHAAAVTEAPHRPQVLKELRTNVQCQVCHKDFHSGKQLSLHMSLVHHNKGDGDSPPYYKQKGKHLQLVCPYCEKKWPSFPSLEVHIRRRHTFSKPFECAHCSVAFADLHALKAHEASKRHLDRLVLDGMMPQEQAISVYSEAVRPLNERNRCGECDHVSLKYSKLREHYRDEHPDKLFRCEACNFETFLEVVYQRHMKRKTHEKMVAINKKVTARASTLEHKCSECDKAFPSSHDRDLHSLTHQITLSEQKLIEAHGGNEYVGIYPKFHNMLDEIKTWKNKDRIKKKVCCPECSSSVLATNFKSHCRKHSEEKMFACAFCANCFPSAIALRRHLENKHLDSSKFQCEHCGKGFNRKTYLQYHVAKEHVDKMADAESHKCTFCEQAFPLKSLLQQHINITHEEKSYKCTWAGCKQQYRFESALKLHMRRHTGEKPFMCELCGYAGANKQMMNRHRLTHTGERKFSCEYCTYKAANSTHLRRHMRIHIGSKPYKCPYCDYACNTHENIRKHIMKTKRHAGLLCYPCKQCTYGTNSVEEYRKHLESVHQQDINDKTILSCISGLYVKEEDERQIPEGGMVIPAKEKLPRISSSAGDKPKPKPKQPRIESMVIELTNDGRVLDVVPKKKIKPIKMDLPKSAQKVIFIQAPQSGVKTTIPQIRTLHVPPPTNVQWIKEEPESGVVSATDQLTGEEVSADVQYELIPFVNELSGDQQKGSEILYEIETVDESGNTVKTFLRQDNLNVQQVSGSLTSVDQSELQMVLAEGTTGGSSPQETYYYMDNVGDDVVVTAAGTGGDSEQVLSNIVYSQ